MKYIKALIVVFVVAIVSLTFMYPSSVNATWYYAMSASGTIEVPMRVEVFPWVGADELPSDVLGEDHEALIHNILNGTYVNENGSITNIGLNNPDSYIAQEINNRANGNFLFRSDVLGSMDYWERSDISKFFDTGTTGLSFVLHFPEDSEEYYLYTTSIDLGESTPNVPVGEKIYPIYRTKLELNEQGEWVATETKTGYADSAYYQNPITGSWLLKYPSFDPDTWFEADLGNDFENAIYAFVGQSTTAYIKNSSDSEYYMIKPSSSGTIKVTTEKSSHIVNVYDNKMSLVKATSGKQGTNNVGFSASANKTYYIEVSGGTSITFSITK